MRTLCTIISGSRLYGLATPTSDYDAKSVFLPDPRAILLQRAPRVLSAGGPDWAGVDVERFSLHAFMKFAAEGQTIPVEMLFTSFGDDADPLWVEIVRNRHRLISKKSQGFMRYFQSQASKFSTKGDRVAAARDTLAMLDAAIEVHGAQAALSVAAEAIEALEANHESIETGVGPDGVAFVSINGRKALLTAALGLARNLAAKIVDQYGQRALMAEATDGADWKALSHALRIGRQAIELFETGEMRFPLRDRAHLLDVKLGRVPFADVSKELDQLAEMVETAALASNLPDDVDHGWIDEFVVQAYGEEVLRLIDAAPTMEPALEPQPC